MEGLAASVALAVWFCRNDEVQLHKASPSRWRCWKIQRNYTRSWNCCSWGPKFFLLGPLGLWIVQPMYSFIIIQSCIVFNFHEFWLLVVKHLWCSFDNAYVLATRNFLERLWPNFTMCNKTWIPGADSSAAVFGTEFLHISGIPRSIAHEHIAAGSEDSALLQTVAFIFWELV